ncbi:uncharacterized protein LOC134206744 [Armigeres subalbatus]|uniref:uncharacterized protein LOC134206744 n=1 Tax=Armigeres subalbatus TaxID=124917 RepID=UPI002ED493EC
MSGRHTALNIVDEIKLILDAYHLDLTQVYSISSDNGSNMLNAAEILTQEQQAELIDQFIEHNGGGFYDVASGLTQMEKYDEELGKIDTIREEQMVEHLAPGSTIEVMRCGAHTVNLVIKDSIKQMNCETNLREIRKVVKRSKAIVFRPIFQIHNAPVPVLDCDTRWGTTPIMVDSFLQLVLLEKQIQTVDPKYNIEKSLIRFAEEFCKAFKPMVTLLKNLQKGQLTVGDLYRYYWIEARIALQKLRHTNSFASALIENLSKRKDKLFENKTFLAGLFMDPRFNFKDTPYLTSEQKNIAIDHLLNTYKVITMRKIEMERKNDSQPTSAPIHSTLSESDLLVEEDCRATSSQPVRSGINEDDLIIKLHDGKINLAFPEGGGRTYAVKVRIQSHFGKLLKMEKLEDGSTVRATSHPVYNQVKFIMYCRDVIGYSTEELRQELEEQGVEAVHHTSKKVVEENPTLPTFSFFNEQSFKYNYG